MDALPLWTLLLLCSVFHLTLSSETRSLRRFSVKNESENQHIWENSNQICRGMNAHLVTVNNADDLKYIEQHMEDAHTYGGVFLGLRTKQNGVSHSEWSNGDQITNLPITLDHVYKQRCVTVHNNKWKTCPCQEPMYFMCYKGTEYKLIEKQKDWCEARRYCRNHYTDLVSIHNNTQNQTAIEAGANKTFWIGLKHDPYTWADGQCSTFTINNDDNDHNKDSRGVDNDDEACAQLSHGDNMTLDSCTHQKHVICMQGNARITAPTVPLTWEEAHNHCKEDHSGLLYIRDEDDQQEVKTWLNVPKSPGPFWIGLRQSRLFGFWIWSTIDQVVEYHNWKGGSPPEVPLSHHCGVLEAGTGKWRDEDCNTRLPALCLEDMYP